MKSDEDSEDLFDIKIGPFGMGAYFGLRPFKVRYSRTSDSHLLRFQINRDVKKEEIKLIRTQIFALAQTPGPDLAFVSLRALQSRRARAGWLSGT